MRLAWLTDIHLNFVTDSEATHFLQATCGQVDAVVITGDIAESPTIGMQLSLIEQCLGRPIYFVLGNHDFYRGSIVGTRHAVSRIAAKSEHLVYLSDKSDVVELSSTTCLVGHDGWGDARLGDFDNSAVLRQLNDFRLISELTAECYSQASFREEVKENLQALGDQSARILEQVLAKAVKDHAQVIIATHVPPFREASWHEGRTCDDDWLPYFTCKAVGDVLLDAAESHVDCEFVVLCGHTHSGGKVRIRSNLQVLTGTAEYGRPTIQRVFQIS